MENRLQTILYCISEADSLNLYFITRKEKENLVGRRRALDKYDFSTLRVDINEDISGYLRNLVQEQIQHAINKRLEMLPYEVIADDQEQIFTYSELNKVGSFAKVINEQLPSRTAIQTMQDFNDLSNQGLIWAYCVELSYIDDSTRKYMYTFRKLNAGNIVVDENDNNPRLTKNLMALFNTQSNKLEKFKYQKMAALI